MLISVVLLSLCFFVVDIVVVDVIVDCISQCDLALLFLCCRVL